MTSAHIIFPDGAAVEQPTGLFINNEFRPSGDGSVFESVNPYTQKPITSVARGKASDVDDAVSAAKAAFRGWRNTEPQARAKALFKLAELVERDAEILAKIEVCCGIRLLQKEVC